ncbi:MAG: ribbon-helix-helix domain-containing protein, partial [Pseudolabrys sp.]
IKVILAILAGLTASALARFSNGPSAADTYTGGFLYWLDYSGFWQGLREIAEHDRTTVAMLVERIDRARNTCNLSSAIHVFVFNHFRDEKNSGGEKHHPALVVA